jgi:hypothetical protein
VVIKGGITVDNGNLNLTLDRADSVLEGFIFSQNSGNAVVNLDNSALWRVSKFDFGNSVASLMVNNGATVDMTFDDTAATELAITDYSGTGGNFIMDTDLAAETVTPTLGPVSPLTLTDKAPSNTALPCAWTDIP